jgi:hypothetical protein
MRKPCYDCCLKHLGKAMVLSSETGLGYPEHCAFIVGNLSEAEDEIFGFSKEIAEEIRQVRLDYMVDFTYDIVPRAMEIFMEVLAARSMTYTKAEEQPLP